MIFERGSTGVYKQQSEPERPASLRHENICDGTLRKLCGMDCVVEKRSNGVVVIDILGKGRIYAKEGDDYEAIVLEGKYERMAPTSIAFYRRDLRTYDERVEKFLIKLSAIELPDVCSDSGDGCYRTRNGWEVKKRINGHSLYFGRFGTEEEAKRWRVVMVETIINEIRRRNEQQQ